MLLKYKFQDTALHAHFTAVADNCPVPVILYSVPAFTGMDMVVTAPLKVWNL